MKSIVLLLLNIWIASAIEVEDVVQITPIENSTGIFFEEIGDVHFYNNVFKIIAYEDLSYLVKEHQLIQSFKQNITDICKWMLFGDFSVDCQNWLLNMNPQTFLTENSTIIGTLDKSDAFYYKEQIGMVQEDKSRNKELLENNTLIVETTNSVYKNMFRDKNVEFLNKSIEQSKNAKAEQLQTQVYEMFRVFEAMIVKFNDNNRIVFKSITAFNEGKIEANVLDPLQMAEISSLNQKDVFVPFDKRVIEMYTHGRQTGSIVNHTAIYELTFPIVQQQKFRVYKVFPLPTTALSNSFVYIQPRYRYLITDELDKFAQVESMQVCTQMRERQYVCHSNDVPLANIKSAETSCELNLLRENRAVLYKPSAHSFQLCLIRQFEANYFLIKLQQTNKWIFSVKNAVLARIESSTYKFDIALNGMGILHLSPRSSLTTEDVTLYGQDTRNRTLWANVIPRQSEVFDQIANSDDDFKKLELAFDQIAINVYFFIFTVLLVACVAFVLYRKHLSQQEEKISDCVIEAIEMMNA